MPFFAPKHLTIPVAVSVFPDELDRMASARGERISVGRERVEAEGGRWGRPSRVGPEVLTRMLKLRQAGRTLRENAVALKVPRTTVARHLAVGRRRPVYR